MLALAPGETIQLSAAAMYKGLPLRAEENSFSWTVDGGVGVITGGGQLTGADDLSAQGTVTVSAGDFTASVTVIIDKDPPQIETTLEGSSLSASIHDEIDTALSASNVKLLVDGAAASANFDSESGTLSAQLPEDGALHHVVIEAGDMSGNWARASLAYEAEGYSCGAVFSDMPVSHWATKYVEYMYHAGILNGKEQNGALRYDPSTGMTRQEFASVMIRFLGTDTSLYEESSFDWTDTDQIADWALPSVKAAAALGIMNGKGAEGSVRFDPLGQISRQEVMTVIGRMQEDSKFGKSDLAAFSDASDVADWALPYVQSLVRQGIISGTDGKLNPAAPVSRAEVAKIVFEYR